MIAVQLTSPDLPRREAPGRSTAATERESERSGIPPTGSATVIAQFQPLDPVGADRERASASSYQNPSFWVVPKAGAFDPQPTLDD
jgi:hypothetical protein